MGWTNSIDAITLFLNDLDASKAFYRSVFDLPVMFEDEASAVFNFESSVVNLLKRSEAPELIDPAPVAPSDAGSRVVFTLAVDDVDRMCTDLRARGVELLNRPMDRPWGVRTASFRDPDGYIWEVAHKIEERERSMTSRTRKVRMGVDGRSGSAAG
jgi:catechol 2,3-dioxygenase-like lactoylglutathione lyase family enzyme